MLITSSFSHCLLLRQLSSLPLMSMLNAAAMRVAGGVRLSSVSASSLSCLLSGARCLASITATATSSSTHSFSIACTSSRRAPRPSAISRSMDSHSSTNDSPAANSADDVEGTTAPSDTDSDDRDDTRAALRRPTHNQQRIVSS